MDFGNTSCKMDFGYFKIDFGYLRIRNRIQKIKSTLLRIKANKRMKNVCINICKSNWHIFKQYKEVKQYTIRNFDNVLRSAYIMHVQTHRSNSKYCSMMEQGRY